MSILVTSNNGRVHLTERISKTKNSKKAPKEYSGYVRKLCDGQWVPENKKIEADITCPVCKKL